VAFLSIGSVTTGSQMLDPELTVDNADLSVAESQYQRHPKNGITLFLFLPFNKITFNLIYYLCVLFLLARYFAGPVARYPQYYPVYPPQDDIYRPDQVQGDEPEADFFRSGYEPRFFGLRPSIADLITALRGPPGNQLGNLLRIFYSDLI
jgi:hypothetical protein